MTVAFPTIAVGLRGAILTMTGLAELVALQPFPSVTTTA